MLSLIIKCVSLLLSVVAIVSLAFAAAAVQVPVAARLGRRGVQRRLSLERGGFFGTAEPAIRFLAGVVALLPLGGLRARQELELRRADYCLGLTPDEYSALSLLSAAVLGGA